MKLLAALCAALALASAVACTASTSETSTATADDALRHRAPVTKESLGALIFADTKLSEPAGQSCATCHDAKHAFTDPRGKSTSEGVIAGRFGVRNAPSIVYASFIPPLLPGGDESGYGGGQFWDGRVDTLQDQAKGPLLNPLEMNNTDAAMILTKLKASSYAQQLITIYGATALDDADTALDNLGDAIAAYETALTGHTRFSSKYDAYLAGKATFTKAEARGFSLFEDKKTGPCTPQADGSMAPPCGCAQCHLDKLQPPTARRRCSRTSAMTTWASPRTPPTRYYKRLPADQQPGLERQLHRPRPRLSLDPQPAPGRSSSRRRPCATSR